MKRLLGLTVCFVLFSGFTLSWSPTTTYTDGSLIEVTKVITYNVERGGATVSAKQLGTSYVFTTGKGVNESFRVQTELNTGEVSAWSPAYSWTSPLGVPGPPSNLRVAP
jgi:hypothetical protein